jgi:hypothetical protein
VYTRFLASGNDFSENTGLYIRKKEKKVGSNFKVCEKLFLKYLG